MADRKLHTPCHRTRKRSENHERLFSAAIEEFNRVGYDAARIERICQKSRVTRPTFYAHFSSKEGVLSELQARQFERVADVLRKRTKDHLDLDGVLDALVAACFDSCNLLPEQLRREMLSCLPRFQRLSDWEHTEAFTILVHSFDRAIWSREIGGHDPRELARDAVSLINGFLIADAGDMEAGARGAHRVLRLFLQGLRATARSCAAQQRTRGAARAPALPA